MFLIAGLGNPGTQYADNRHNIGFLIVDHWACVLNVGSFQDRFGGLFLRCVFQGQDLILYKPMDYMNHSGKGIARVMRYFKVSRGQIIVIHDELDLPYGTCRIKIGGGTAGHNGLKSVQECLGSDFIRIRIGVGRPAPDPVSLGKAKALITKHVLSDFTKQEQTRLPKIMAFSVKMLEYIVLKGPKMAMNDLHRCKL